MSIMRRELIHINSCMSVYSYGLAMAVAILVFIYLCNRHPWRKKIMSSDLFLQTTLLGVFAGIGGCRLLFTITNWHQFNHWYEFFYLWDGGLSMLGGILGILVIVPWYLRYHHIPILPFFDLAALYAPILHAIARLGCFMTGCCYGMPTTLPWAITYTDRYSEAPLNVGLHPTQLYTSIALVITFFALRALHNRLKAGQLFMLYLMSEAAIRFGIDYVRNDHEYFALPILQLLTIHQWISVALFVASFVGLVILNKAQSPRIQQ